MKALKTHIQLRSITHEYSLHNVCSFPREKAEQMRLGEEDGPLSQTVPGNQAKHTTLYLFVIDHPTLQ